MAPKKSAPPPQSDESESDQDEVSVVRKPKKKVEKPAARKAKNDGKGGDEPGEEAVNKNAEGSDDDDDTDLFQLELPPRPEFLTKQSTADRLMISNVEVENFKSYWGKASIGPFHKSFTSIIGPNGSGKSNLIDALLFVFGFRAAKIRSAKVANLIHKSRNREPESCTVTIYFQKIIDMPNQTYQVVENSKFNISRSAYRNSSSSYAINGRAATKSEVEAKLKSVEIDIEHNRFLILQGEVEQIAMMKPVRTNKSETGMIEYLEDIIGTNRLEPFVKRFQKRVNNLVCQQSQQNITREHARASKTALESSVRDAVEFLVKENEMTTIKMKLAQRRKLRYMDKAAPLQAEIDAKIEEKNEIAKKLDSNRKQNEETDELDKKLTKEKNQLDKEIDKLTKELNDINQEETRRKDTLKRYETELQKLEADKEKEEKKRKNYEAAPEKAEKKVEKLKEEIENLREIEDTARATVTKNLSEFDDQSKNLKEEHRKVEAKWAEEREKLNKISAEATVKRLEVEDLKKVANSGSKNLGDVKAKLEAIEARQEKNKLDYTQKKKEYEETGEKLKRYNHELPLLVEEVRKLDREFSTKQERYEYLKTNNANAGNDVVSLLLAEKAAGRIPSFIGRLGDMGTTDAKYDPAISTNFHNQLRYLIVGRVEDSPKVIEFLHKNQLPRESVQPLDRIQYKPGLDKGPQGQYPVPRLYDMIKCEPEVRPAFYDALRETLIANDMREAQRLNQMPACSGSSVACLNGDLVAANGSVTGGGAKRGLILVEGRPKRKGVKPEDLAEEKALANVVPNLKREFENRSQEKRQMDYETAECRKAHTSLGHFLENLKATISEDAESIEMTAKAVKRLEEEAKKKVVNQKEIDEKEVLAVAVERKRDVIAENVNEVKEQVDEFQSKLDGLFNQLVGSFKKEADDAKDKRAKLEKEMAKESASITNSSVHISRCNDNIARLEKDIKKKEEACEQLKEKERDPEVVEEKQKAVDEREAKRKELETEYEEMGKKRTALSSEETELEDSLKARNEEVMELKRTLQDHNWKVGEIEKELSKMQLNRVPKFQFLAAGGSRPEDMEMEFEQEPIVDENQSPEEMERQRRHMACVMRDKGYAIEFALRKKVMEMTESYENVDGPKLIPVNFLSDEDVRAITKRDAEQLQFNLKLAEEAFDVLKNKVDISCIDTYISKVNLFNQETIKLALVNEQHRKHHLELQRIKKMRMEEFHAAFEFIGQRLVGVYKMLTDNGDAKLEYIDKDDPFNQGISFMVRPPKKAWKQIQYLSGGEKTLSSLALIFALHVFRPTPFYVMDEIDAALDYRNVSIIGQHVCKQTENAQFIIISLRNNMFELANRLIGIYKVDGCTQNVAIDPLAVCHTAKLISESLGQHAATTPEEVTANFNESVRKQNKEIISKEKQYANFPSSSEITKAEKIVSVEGRVRKQLNNTTIGEKTAGGAGPSRPQTKASERPQSTRPESRANHMKMPAPRLVARGSNAATSSSSETGPATTSSTSATSVTPSKTPRKTRRSDPNDDDETTPPAKRSNSTNNSPRKSMGSSEKKRKNAKNSSREEEDEE